MFRLVGKMRGGGKSNLGCIGFGPVRHFVYVFIFFFFSLCSYVRQLCRGPRRKIMPLFKVFRDDIVRRGRRHFACDDCPAFFDRIFVGNCSRMTGPDFFPLPKKRLFWWCVLQQGACSQLKKFGQVVKSGKPFCYYLEAESVAQKAAIKIELLQKARPPPFFAKSSIFFSFFFSNQTPPSFFPVAPLAECITDDGNYSRDGFFNAVSLPSLPTLPPSPRE